MYSSRQDGGARKVASQQVKYTKLLFGWVVSYESVVVGCELWENWNLFGWKFQTFAGWRCWKGDHSVTRTKIWMTLVSGPKEFYVLWPNRLGHYQELGGGTWASFVSVEFSSPPLLCSTNQRLPAPCGPFDADGGPERRGCNVAAVIRRRREAWERPRGGRVRG
jgi:hypothetical protein